MARDYHVISADSHLEISPERWRNRVPATYRDRAPRLVKLANGGDAILLEGRPLSVVGLAVTGKPYDEYEPTGVTYEGGRGTGSPEQRISEQDQDGIDAEVIFTGPGNAGLWRAIRDDDAYRAVIHAYNEFLAEEYCAVDRDRLFAMAVIPSSGVEDAIAEMGYCARAGLKGVMLGTFPSGRGYPTPEDDRFWAAALDLGMPITAHVRLVLPPGDPVFKYKREPGELESFATDPVWNLTRFAGDSAQNAVQMILAGVFDRFPKLRVYFAETMIGWLPHFLVQVDDNYARARHWAERYFGLEPPPRGAVSEYIKEHCLWGFLRDPFGVEMRHRIGVDNVLWGSDFPHSAGDWPNSRRLHDELFQNVPAQERWRMTAGNAIDFFHLEHAGRRPEVAASAGVEKRS